ncbi:MAG: bile acid:sodium symporter family protein [Rhodopirellula sp.]|nr:bile acid:sodium symporter family protein [Rhodopirellula sp.]
MERAGQFIQKTLLAWLVLFCVAALVWTRSGLPDPFLGTADFQLDLIDPVFLTGTSRPLLGVMIQMTMFCIGCMISVSEVNEVFRRWPLVLGGTLIQYTSMPLLAWSLGNLFGLEREYLVGVIVVGCVPGAMASNVLTLAARGNVSFSVSLTTSATILSPIIVPLAFQLTLSTFVEIDPLNEALKLLKQVVGPVLIGHLLCRFWQGGSRLAQKAAPLIANGTIVWLIAVVVALNRDRLLGVFGGEVASSGKLLVVLLLINLLGYAAGYFGGGALRLKNSMRRALTLEVGMQNAGLGTVLVLDLFKDQPAAAIPTAVYTFGCMLTGTLLAQWWSFRPPSDTNVGEAENAAASGSDDLDTSVA